MCKSFHEIHKSWASYLLKEDKKQQINFLLDGQGLILFFIHDNMVFGATEPNRVSFSQIKHTGDENPPGWRKNANFTAFNLSKCIASNHPEQKIFYAKDSPQINVISKEEAFDILMDNIDSLELSAMQQGNQQLAKLIFTSDMGKNDEP